MYGDDHMARALRQEKKLRNRQKKIFGGYMIKNRILISPSIDFLRTHQKSINQLRMKTIIRQNAVHDNHAVMITTNW